MEHSMPLRSATIAIACCEMPAPPSSTNGHRVTFSGMNSTSDYDYHLPAELIAQQPVEHRVDSRLMLIDRAKNSIDHYHIRDLPEILSANDLLVCNNSQVLPARLVGRRKKTGGRWQGLFLDFDEQGIWRLLGKTRGKIQVGETVVLEDADNRKNVEIKLVARLDNGQWAAEPRSRDHAYELLDRVGRVPLPPYIRGGEMEPSDVDRYQTVFAESPGSVAAPTAGLHFTPNLLKKLEDLGVNRTFVTLHVGVGTFRPVTAEQLDEHVMHTERAWLWSGAAADIDQAKVAGGRVIAVGTTSVRVLESAANATRAVKEWSGETDLFIRPPYEFKRTDGLLTNFHLPKSTLLVLVRTFGGDELLKRAYEEAVTEEYRFYSYGDAMLIL